MSIPDTEPEDESHQSSSPTMTSEEPVIDMGSAQSTTEMQVEDSKAGAMEEIGVVQKEEQQDQQPPAEVPSLQETKTEDTQTEETKAEEPQPESIQAEPHLPKRKLCGVCHEKESLYNCRRCHLPFCGIPCLRAHEESHAAPSPPKPPVVPKAPSPVPTNGRPGTIAGSQAPNPFSSLDDSAKLKMLFKQYPSLPSTLIKIYETTLRPLPPTSPPSNNRYRGNNRKEEEWNSDKGMQKGVEALNKLKNTDSKEAEGVREYCRLVLGILEEGEESGEEVKERIRRELIEESRKIVEGLLELER